VLSGFLITYLLFSEREKTGTNSLLKFYVRRTLRIWPLYFGIVLFSFFIVPLIFSLIGKLFHEPSNIFYFLFFASNFQSINGINPYSPLLVVLWSIAIEEQFYVSWPVLFKFLFRKIEWVFPFIILGSIVFRAIHIHDHRLIYAHTFSIVSDFAIGGYVAYCSFYRNKLFQWLSSLSKSWIAIIYFFIVIMLFGYNLIFSTSFMTVFERAILGAGFGFIIFEQTFCEHSLFKAGNVKLFSWLGKISYGLYCFHELGLILTKDLLVYCNSMFLPAEYMILFPVIALLFTVLISWLSYHYYEKWFLQWKEKFSFQR
jgi:peptidoglycan/LPS O-acetylase OafA/YrhL